MTIEGETLDDLLYKSLEHLVKLPFTLEATRSDKKGPTSEMLGVILELNNPRARLSRSDTKGKSFSALGEFLWYLAGNDRLSFIEYYLREYRDESYNKKRIYGAYGPRLFKSIGKYNQIDNVLFLLKQRNTSRRAVIQIFEARDIEPTNKKTKKSIPCTCTLQFILREDKLTMITFMRSNDSFKGFPHDLYAFTMLQEYLATALGVQLGSYKHCVGSFHLYKSDETAANDYLKEGCHRTTEFMDPMPMGDQTPAIKTVLKLEKKIRTGKKFDIEGTGLAPFWKNIAYLLQFYKSFTDKDIPKMKQIKGLITDIVYSIDLDRKINLLEGQSKINA